jgi:hypothetical protein
MVRAGQVSTPTGKGRPTGPEDEYQQHVKAA